MIRNRYQYLFHIQLTKTHGLLCTDMKTVIFNNNICYPLGSDVHNVFVLVSHNIKPPDHLLLMGHLLLNAVHSLKMMVISIQPAEETVTTVTLTVTEWQLVCEHTFLE